MTEMQQTQKAGKDSNLLQAGSITVNNNTFVGITEQRAREIFNSEMSQRIESLAVESQDIATRRMLELFSNLMTRIKKCEKDLSSFSDPSFLRNVRIAQEAAAISERKNDIETLSELLLARMNGKLKRSTKTGLRKAMEIVPELEEEELVALTALLFYTRYHVNNSRALHVTQYLECLNGFFKAVFLSSSLPAGTRWLKHLRILDCVEVNHISSFKKVDDYYAELASGIICAGIAKDSPEHLEAVKILNECGLSADIFMQNDLLPGYMRLPLANLNDYSALPSIPNIPIVFSPMKLNEKQKDGLRRVIDLYKNDNGLVQKAKSLFAEKMAGYEAIQRLKIWLEEQKYSFELTPIGEALAYVNARRCIPGLPVIELE